MPTVIRRFLNAGDNPVVTAPSAAALPASLVIPPGIYTYGGVNYDFTQPGAYFGWDQGNVGFNRIVNSGDVDALMSSLAWLCVDGLSDEALTPAAKTTAALTRRIAALCSSTVAWAKSIADGLGMQSRVVHALTGGTPNNYYDGHTLLEVMVGGAWKTYDLANGFRYSTPGGLTALKDVLPLTASMVCDPIADQAYEHASPSSGWNAAAWRHITARTPTTLMSEIQRVLQMPGITDTDNQTYFYTPAGMEARASYITGLGYAVLTQSAWLARFYP